MITRHHFDISSFQSALLYLIRLYRHYNILKQITMYSKSSLNIVNRFLETVTLSETTYDKTSFTPG